METDVGVTGTPPPPAQLVAMSVHAFPPRGVSAAAPPSLSPLDLFQLALALTVVLVFRRLWT